jgi:tRNA 2-thiouridine synthesizing protein B
MLYTVNKTPFSTNNLESALRVAPAGAPILLYEDGVYAAVDGARSAGWMKEALTNHPMYALEADLEARGLTRVIQGIQVINYDGFVELVEQHDVAPWL